MRGQLWVTTQIGPGKSWRLKVAADKINQQRINLLLNESGHAFGTQVGAPASASCLEKPQQPRPGFCASLLLPRPAARQKHQEITLTLGHDAAALWFGAIEGSSDEGDVFEYPAALLKSIIVRHDIARERRQASEARAGRELSRRTRRRRQERSGRRAQQSQTRITAELNLACAVLIRWCVAHGVTSVDYDAAPRAFTEHFPYRRLADTFASNWKTIGIACIAQTWMNSPRIP